MFWENPLEILILWLFKSNWHCHISYHHRESMIHYLNVIFFSHVCNAIYSRDSLILTRECQKIIKQAFLFVFLISWKTYMINAPSKAVVKWSSWSTQNCHYIIFSDKKLLMPSACCVVFLIIFTFILVFCLMKSQIE